MAFLQPAPPSGCCSDWFCWTSEAPPGEPKLARTTPEPPRLTQDHLWTFQSQSEPPLDLPLPLLLPPCRLAAPPQPQAESRTAARTSTTTGVVVQLGSAELQRLFSSGSDWSHFRRSRQTLLLPRLLLLLFLSQYEYGCQHRRRARCVSLHVVVCSIVWWSVVVCSCVWLLLQDNCVLF